MSASNDIIALASRLPLYDAAYSLWRQKPELDRQEAPTRAQRPPVDLTNPDVVANAMREAVAQVVHDRRTAHEGPTFERLKQAHPGARDEDIRQAIKAAVKLDSDCVRHFASRSLNHFDDLTRAVAQAREDNPGFQQETYEILKHQLFMAMR